MENKEKIFYDSMCNNCQEKFKKVIIAAKKNPLKDLKDLELLGCDVDKNGSLTNDNGLVPLAFIFCKNDSYVFFWKEDLYNGDGSPKIKISNNRIKLSQATIEQIKQNNSTKNNQLLVTSKEETHMIAQQLIKNNNQIMQRSFKRQILLLNHRHFLHMSKMKKMIISITLVLILLLAATGGTLGWYFSYLENKIVNGQLPNNNWRMNLNEHLKNKDLGDITDNCEETILTAVKEKNSEVQIEDLYVINITKISATVGVKSSSNLYDPNSTVNINYIAGLITLATDVKKRSFPNSSANEDPNKLMQIIASANSTLRVEEVKIANVLLINDTITADLIVRPGSQIYLKDDILKLYFTKNNRQLLSDVLTTENIGDVVDNNKMTILNKIKEVNQEVDIAQIEIVLNSISDQKALVQVKKDSTSYILNDEKIAVNFRIFNSKIGSIKQVINNNVSSIISMAQRKDNGKILASDFWGTLYQLDSDGKNEKELYRDSLQNHYKLLILSNGKILAGGDKGYNYNYEGVIRQVILDKDNVTFNEVSQEFDGSITALTQLFNGTILAATAGESIYQLDSNGKIIKQLVDGGFSGGIDSIIQLADGRVLAATREQWIYQLDSNGYNFTKLTTIPLNGISGIVQLNNGIILIADNKGIYQMNPDGTIKGQVEFAKSDSIFNFGNNITWVAKSDGIYELNTG
ncbi:hypothetical protein [Spiroplasma chrysopicola]|uniref:Uncharacterized protein n=1 Tax=Spiroplasma chrysopicola DF-1 TaxID=1276227 RepID=R4UGE7_9MOLU|nr:hypothetical protein [Spiroplasma chrysopicola]AGM25185.1 hypothetical protein SCHRY_v1c06070 [Spiroplasma chrysopicola DF-1]